MEFANKASTYVHVHACTLHTRCYTTT